MKIKTQHWDAADKSNHYDAIKFVATFLVVLAHASRMYTGTGVVIPYNASDGLNHLTNIIYSFHMPLYMSVSGMVYALCIHDYQKYQDTARFLKNKAIRLLIPYLFFWYLLCSTGHVPLGLYRSILSALLLGRHCSGAQ